jgi:hypothetical protein
MHPGRRTALVVFVLAVAGVPAPRADASPAEPRIAIDYGSAQVDVLGQDTPGTYETVFGVPVGDLDGDGLPDVALLRFVRRDGLVVASGVEGRHGADGSSLWRHDTGWLGIPRPFGTEDGRAGVLVTGYESTANGRVRTLAVDVLGPDGTLLWSRRDTGVTIGYGVGATYAGYATLADVRQATGGPAGDVLIRKDTFLALPSVAPVSSAPVSSVVVVDGGTGEIAAALPPLADYPSRVAFGPDLSGDGLADVVVVGGTSGTVAAYRGSDGAILWSSPFSSGPPAVVLDVGDVTGDGTSDIAVSVTAEGAVTTLFDGRTGVALWTKDGLGRATGDIDGDGREDVATISFTADDRRAIVRHEAFGAAGVALYSAAYGLDVPQDNRHVDVRLRTVIGDVDDDGVSDAGHEIVLEPGEGQLTESGMVSGRTGAKLWAGRLGRTLGASADGNGADLVEVATVADEPLPLRMVDGATGSALWQTDLAADVLVGEPAATDLDGDGHADVIVGTIDHERESPTSGTVAALSGADGRTLWDVRGREADGALAHCAPADAPPTAVGVTSCSGVRPGAAVTTIFADGSGSLCSLNFLFAGADGARYVGTAGHCVLDSGTRVFTDGPVARVDGVAVGTYAYGRLDYLHDFALIRLNEGVAADASMMHFGGPVGLFTEHATSPTVVHHYGHGLLAGELTPARSGVLVSSFPQRNACTTSAATFGDSGSGVIDDTGRALGLMVTLVVCAAGLNGVQRLDYELPFAEEALGTSLSLQTAPLRG